MQYLMIILFFAAFVTIDAMTVLRAQSKLGKGIYFAFIAISFAMATVYVFYSDYTTVAELLQKVIDIFVDVKK